MIKEHFPKDNNQTLQQALLHFFNINSKEYIRMFVPEAKQKMLFGKELTIYSSPKDVAQNIYSFLDNEFHLVFTKRVLIEKHMSSTCI